MDEDTIWAVATPPGSAARGIVRISGPRALDAAARVGVRLPRERRVREIPVAVLAGRAVPALVLVMPGPRSATGEDVVELHLPGGPLLLELVGTALAPVARPAVAGEFTRRAFENGRLSLSQAEAVLDLIHAADVGELRQAAAALGGAVRDAVAAIRARIDDARALIEVGLDFDEGETGAVAPELWRGAVADARDRLAALAGELPQARTGGGDVLLLGAANAGKSSLCNALAGREVVLVSAGAGTTRDVVAVPLAGGARLLDAPGDVDAPGEVDAAALAARDRRAVAAVLWVVDPHRRPLRFPAVGPAPVLAIVWTHGGPAPDGPRPVAAPEFVVDSPRGAGVAALADFVRRTAPRGPGGRGARIADALARARDGLADVLARGAGGDELAAADLARAVAALDEVDGRSPVEGLLDRVFAGFCLGK